MGPNRLTFIILCYPEPDLNGADFTIPADNPVLTLGDKIRIGGGEGFVLLFSNHIQIIWMDKLTGICIR